MPSQFVVSPVAPSTLDQVIEAHQSISRESPEFGRASISARLVAPWRRVGYSPVGLIDGPQYFDVLNAMVLRSRDKKGYVAFTNRITGSEPRAGRDVATGFRIEPRTPWEQMGLGDLLPVELEISLRAVSGSYQAFLRWAVSYDADVARVLVRLRDVPAAVRGSALYAGALRVVGESARLDLLDNRELVVAIVRQELGLVSYSREEYAVVAEVTAAGDAWLERQPRDRFLPDHIHALLGEWTHHVREVIDVRFSHLRDEPRYDEDLEDLDFDLSRE